MNDFQVEHLREMISNVLCEEVSLDTPLLVDEDQAYTLVAEIQRMVTVCPATLTDFLLDGPMFEDLLMFLGQ